MIRQLTYLEKPAIQCPHCGHIFEIPSLRHYEGIWQEVVHVWRDNGHITTSELEKRSIGFTRRQIQNVLRQFETYGFVVPIGKRGGWRLPETHAC